MPIDTPEAIPFAIVAGRRRARRASRRFCWRANRSHAAISIAALAMWCPRIGANASNSSRGMREGAAQHHRRRGSRADDVPGRARRFGAVERAAHPRRIRRRPTAPSSSTVTSTNARSSIRPKLVSKKRTSGRRSRRSSIRSIRTGQCYRNRSRAFAILRRRGEPRPRAARLSSTLDFRYIAIEGPAGVGKSLLADRLGSRLDATVVLDETENPFLADFYADRPGAAFQAQLFFTLSRHRQQTALRQSDLFSQLTVCDYLFDRDKIYAYLNLDDNELFIYQRLYELLAQDVPSPDLVIFLQTPTDVLRRRAARARARQSRPAVARRRVRPGAERGLQPLLLPLHRHAAAGRGDLAVRPVVGRGRARRPRTATALMGKGTRYYVPRK